VELAHHLSLLSSRLSLGRQHDAQEYVTFLLDSIERHCTRRRTLPLLNGPRPGAAASR